jgi:hypothetical protein
LLQPIKIILDGMILTPRVWAGTNGRRVGHPKQFIGYRFESGTTQERGKSLLQVQSEDFLSKGNGTGTIYLPSSCSKNGVSQPAVIFPANYSHKRNKLGNSVYIVEPICPK